MCGSGLDPNEVAVAVLEFLALNLSAALDAGAYEDRALEIPGDDPNLKCQVMFEVLDRIRGRMLHEARRARADLLSEAHEGESRCEDELERYGDTATQLL
jgi:hypothetical protein